MARISVKSMNSSYMNQMAMLLQEHLNSLAIWKDKDLEWSAYVAAIDRTMKLNRDKVSIRDKAHKKYVFTMDVVDAHVLRLYFNDYNSGNHPYLDFVFNDFIQQIDKL